MTFAFIGLAIIAAVVVFLLVIVNYDTNEVLKKQRFDAAADGTKPQIALVPSLNTDAAQDNSSRSNSAASLSSGRSSGANLAASGGLTN